MFKHTVHRIGMIPIYVDLLLIHRTSECIWICHYILYLNVESIYKVMHILYNYLPTLDIKISVNMSLYLRANISVTTNILNLLAESPSNYIVLIVLDLTFPFPILMNADI